MPRVLGGEKKLFIKSEKEKLEYGVAVSCLNIRKMETHFKWKVKLAE